MSFFDEFDQFIQRQFNEFFRMFQNIPQLRNIEPQIEETEGHRTIRWGPIVYGRSTIVGPDGKVHTQEWSNLSPEAQKQFEDQFSEGFSPFMLPPQPRQPSPGPIDPLPPSQPFPGPQPEPRLKEPSNYLIDVIDTRDGYVAIFDTPATVKEDIQAQVDDHHLKLWVWGRLFHELELPELVELQSLHFKNGVVELRLRAKTQSSDTKPSTETAETGTD